MTEHDFDWEIHGTAHISGLTSLPENVRGALDEEAFAVFYDSDADGVLLVSVDDVDPAALAGPADSELETREAALARLREAIASLRRIPAPAFDEDKSATLSDSMDGLVSLERQVQNEVEQMREDGDRDVE